MRRLPFISALITAVAGVFSRKPKRRTVQLHSIAEPKRPKSKAITRAQKRLRRIRRWQYGLRLVFRERNRARYGIALPGEPQISADDRRRLRNARKLERQGRR